MAEEATSDSVSTIFDENVAEGTTDGFVPDTPTNNNHDETRRAKDHVQNHSVDDDEDLNALFIIAETVAVVDEAT